MSKSPDLILIDGSSYLFRAYYALPPLTNKQGMPTGAIYGVINMLKKLKAQYDCAHFAVIFDPKGKNFRHELYPDYKANRTAMPDELRDQIAPLHAIIRAMGIPLIIEEGVEADDVIGVFTRRAEKNDWHTLISTGDKDIAQLVSKNTTLINTMTGKMLDTKGVKEKFGVKAEQIIDYLALIGDSSDNIPGVQKVGPKTAVKWLDKYQSLDNIIKHADEFTGKIGDNLRAHLDFFPLGIKLVTIDQNIPVKEKLSDLCLTEPDIPALRKLYTELEFSNWLTLLDKGQAPAAVKSKNDYTIIQTQTQWQDYLTVLKKQKIFAFDSETDSLDAMRANCIGLSFATAEGKAVYVPLQHDKDLVDTQLPLDAVMQDIKKLFATRDHTIVGQNLKYDLKMLHKYDVTATATCWDTMLAAYVLEPAGRHDLDTLANRHLNIQPIAFTDIAGKGAKQKTFNQIPLTDAAAYACEDADLTWQLYEIFNAQLGATPSLKKIFTHLETPLLKTLINMEITGVHIDAKHLQDYSKQLGEKISSLEQKIIKEAGEAFNIDSPKQLQKILFDQLKYPVLKKTPQGQPSTAEEVLQQLALDYPLPKHILSYRSLSKLKSTYADALPEQIDPKTERVHPIYRQTGTGTGRLSCKNPNLQNIPVRTDAGREIRRAFTATRGRRIVSADYSQIELRLMAHISQDPSMRQAFDNGDDIHTATAAEVFNCKKNAVSTEQRRQAKAVNFGLLYGMSAFGLAKQLGADRATAQQYIDTYFDRYPKVQQYMEKIRQQAHDQGYVDTLMGRRLTIPNIRSKNVMQRKAAERAAINAPLQGSAADLIKTAMIHIEEALARTSLDAKMIMQVHDELVFDVAIDDMDRLVKLVEKHMTQAMTLSVPLEVTIGVGKNWDDAH